MSPSELRRVCRNSGMRSSSDPILSLPVSASRRRPRPQTPIDFDLDVGIKDVPELFGWGQKTNVKRAGTTARN